MAGLFKSLIGKVHIPDPLLLERKGAGFSRAHHAADLFPPTDPAVDGDECLHDCQTCSVELPDKWKIEESLPLYGHIKGWSRHLIVATGKNDWQVHQRMKCEILTRDPGLERFVKSKDP
jgi:hypothetical protein